VNKGRKEKSLFEGKGELEGKKKEKKARLGAANGDEDPLRDILRKPPFFGGGGFPSIAGGNNKVGDKQKRAVRFIVLPHLLPVNPQKKKKESR